MVNRNLIREFDVSDDDWNAAIGVEPGMELVPEELDWLGGEDVSVNQIVEGKIVRVDNEFVIVDVGYKSEGMVARNEWEPEEEGEEPGPPPEIGQTVRVLVEEVEDVTGRHDDRGMLVLSKSKAEKIEKWMAVMESVHEGDVVTGTVTRKIKGGLLVDIGVNVFLPASQVDIRRPHDIGEYIDKDHRVHGAEDRRGASQHRGQSPELDRSKNGPPKRRRCSRNLKLANFAPAW